MERNLISPFGNNPLNYPHFTKVTSGEMHVVTSSDNLIQVGDVLEYNKFRNNDNGVVIKKTTVISIKEQRQARGEHRIENPIFQLLEISN